MGEHRNGEVDPDGALDDQNQQQGHRHGFEGKEQHHQHDEDAHHADDDVVPGEGFLKLIGVGGVSDDENLPIGVMPAGHLGDGVGEGVGLVAADGKVEIDQHAAVVCALELELAVCHAVGSIAQARSSFIAQRDIALLYAVPYKEEHVDERHGIGVDTAHQLAIILLLGGVCGIDKAAQLIVDVRKLRELPGRELVGQGVAVHGLNVRKAHGALHLRHIIEFVQNRPLGLVVPGWHDQRHQVRGGEVLFDHLLGDLLLVELGRHDRVITIDIRALAGDKVGPHNQHHEEDGHESPGGIGKFADEGDLGDEAFVAGLFDPRPEEHQQAGHEYEHGKQGEENCLDKADAHIRAQPELHEQHGHKPAHGGEAAGADLRDALAEGLDDRLPQRQRLMLLLEAVAEDHRVVQRQRQLQNAGHRVGNERDLAQQEVGAHVHQHGADEGQQQHRDLRPGLAGERQHADHDGRHDDHDDVDLALDDLRKLIAQRCIQISVIGAVALQHCVQCLHAGAVGLRIVEGDVVEGGDVVVMVAAVVKSHTLHAVHASNFVRDLCGAVVGHAGKHQLGGAEGRKLIGHHIQPLPRFRLGRQVGCQVVFHLDPIAGHDGKNQHQADQKKNQIAFIDDKSGELDHEARPVSGFGLDRIISLAPCGAVILWQVLPC